MFRFAKTIPLDGFGWGEDWKPDFDSSGDGPYLVQKGERGRITYPLEENPTLFEEFANLNNGEDSLLPTRINQFANQHGNLGLSIYLYNPEDSKQPTVRGEGFPFWKKEILEMAVAYRLWHFVEMGSVGNLSRTVHWDDNLVGITYNEVNNFRKFKSQYISGPFQVIANGMHITFLRGDLIGPAKYFLSKIINEKIMGHVSPRILLDQEYNMHSYFMPDSLLAAIWMQLYLAVTGINKYIRCDICGGLIEITEGNRSSKRVHTRCAKNRSDRKKRVLELAKSGRTVEEITAAVKEDSAIVEKWIKAE